MNSLIFDAHLDLSMNAREPIRSRFPALTPCGGWHKLFVTTWDQQAEVPGEETFHVGDNIKPTIQ